MMSTRRKAQSFRREWRAAAALALLLPCLSPAEPEQEDGRGAATEKPDPAWSIPSRPVPAPPPQWPERPGEASVCLWRGDKLCAFSLTIDDNCAPNIPWWIEQGEKFGFRFTWFVITERITEKEGNFGGDWATFRKLVALGHDVQSHTVSHLHGEYTIEQEYAQSKAAIEQNIPGHRCLVLAYPGGSKGREAKGMKPVPNDAAAAAKHYIGGRGVVGFVTPAVGMPYMKTGKQGGYFTAPGAGLDSFLDPQHKNYRGWYIGLHHLVKDEAKPEILRGLQFLKDHESVIWVGLFREVLMYARQRDTARVRTDAGGPDRIVFTLTDEMDDAIFDLPLTVKVRLPAEWPSAKAEQSGKAIPCAVVEREGARYALVDAVPDRGAVALTRSAAL